MIFLVLSYLFLLIVPNCTNDAEHLLDLQFQFLTRAH
jgi:competence protein ComGC